MASTCASTYTTETMTTSELKDYLRKRGLPLSGSKSELQKRVKGAISMNLQEVSESETPRAGRLVSPLNENLPNPAELKSGWTDICEIPVITEDQLYNYLVLDKQRTFDFESIGARRSLKARVFYEDGHVHSLAFHPVGEKISHGFVKAKCIPSLPPKNTKDKPDYEVWICLSKITGRIHSANCTCTAGAGESCNHISALLYALVDISRMKESGKLSSTSQPCKWNKPRKRKLSPVRSCEMKFQKFEWKENKQPPDMRKSDRTTKPVTAILDVEKFRKSVEQELPQAAWIKNFPKNVTTPKEHISVPHLHNIPFCYRNSVDLSSESCVKTFETYFESLSINDETAKFIEKTTRGQSKCDLWRTSRIGRLTASSFGIVVRRKESTPPDNLVKYLLCYTQRCETAAMKWGIQKESIARDSYVTFQRNSHPPLTVQESGLVISTKFPHLGASPDGLVYCPHCPQYAGLLEIKCPFTYKDITPYEAAKKKDFFCTLTKSGSVKLKRNHSYFVQVQGQLALTGRQWCDFVVWTTCGMSIERIYFDQKLWTDTILPKLNRFYKYGLIPELFSARVKRNMKLYN